MTASTSIRRKPTCSTYLAVEANVTAVLPNTDCGGRVLDADVIETTYSVLVAGGVSGVDDAVASDDVTHSNETFPFLADPIAP